jgi:hypothetical protein
VACTIKHRKRCTSDVEDQGLVKVRANTDAGAQLYLHFAPRVPSLTENAGVVSHCVLLLPPEGSSRRNNQDEEYRSALGLHKAAQP